MNRNDWAHNLLDRLGAPHTNHNAYALVSWMQAEGGNALWNPLNTTQPEPGSWDYNFAHVQNYPTYEEGVDAVLRTLGFPGHGYEAIVKHLRESAKPAVTLKAVEASDWGTGGLALKVLPYVKAHYWQYASHTIAGS